MNDHKDFITTLQDSFQSIFDNEGANLKVLNILFKHYSIFLPIPFLKIFFLNLLRRVYLWRNKLNQVIYKKFFNFFLLNSTTSFPLSLPPSFLHGTRLHRQQWRSSGEYHQAAVGQTSHRTGTAGVASSCQLKRWILSLKKIIILFLKSYRYYYSNFILFFLYISLIFFLFYYYYHYYQLLLYNHLFLFPPPPPPSSLPPPPPSPPPPPPPPSPPLHILSTETDEKLRGVIKSSSGCLSFFILPHRFFITTSAAVVVGLDRSIFVKLSGLFLIRTIWNVLKLF